MRLSRSMWRAVLAILLVLLPLTALVVVPAVGAADPVLYTQMNNVAVLSTSPSTDYSPALDTSDSMTADDFTIPVKEKWQITQVDVIGAEVGSGTLDTFDVYIYSNVAGDPGAVVYSGTGLAYIETGFNYSIALPTGPTLVTGTYWLVVQGNTTGTLGWVWSNRSTQNGSLAQFVNPGGAISPGCTTGWSNRNSCVAFTTNNEDQNFALFGLQQPNLPPVNTVPGAQTTNDNVNIVFGAANSNAISVTDPDVTTENISTTLTVLHGTLTLPVTTGLVTVTGNSTNNLFIFGSLAAINLRLDGLIYDPTDGYGGPDTLTMLSDDFGQNGTGGAKTDSDTVAITVKARTQLNLGVNSMQYGGSSANLNACLDTLYNPTDAATDLSGQTIVFKIDGTTTIASGTTNAMGCVNVTGVVTSPGLNVGTYFNRLTAHFAGSTYLLPSDDTTSTLSIARRVLWVKPVDRTVVLKAPNPSTIPSQIPGCVAPNWCLELSAARGSSFAPGESFANLNLTQLRFQYNRNPPATNATETVGKVYKITAFTAASTNYDIRYDPGTLTVVAAP